MKRRSAFATEIFLDPVEVLDRDVESVAFRVFELEVLAMCAVRLDEAHALEARDAVVDMHHELVGLEVEGELFGQVGSLGSRAAPAGRPAPPPQHPRALRQLNSNCPP